MPRDLERAYIAARYYFEEFFEDEVREAFEAPDRAGEAAMER